MMNFAWQEMISAGGRDAAEWQEKRTSRDAESQKTLGRAFPDIIDHNGHPRYQC
jgi:hypothetical protein